MAKWKELPRSIPPRRAIPMRWAYNPTAEEMEKLLDSVFYHVFRRVPVAKYEEGITGPQDCTDYICFCETEEMQCGDRIEKEDE